MDWSPMRIGDSLTALQILIRYGHCSDVTRACFIVDRPLTHWYALRQNH